MSTQMQINFVNYTITPHEKKNSLYAWCQNNDKVFLLEEWDNEKNTIDPQEVSYKSEKSAWWKCSKNPRHKWKTSIGNRTSQNTSCPYCANKKVLIGDNDLANTNPDYLKEWDFNKNEIKPTEITAGSNKTVWWLCKNYKHSWKASPASRISGKTGCPVCAGLTIVKGFNDLETLFPEIAKEWDYSKNEKTPDSVSGLTSRKAWWKCSKGHSWEASIVARTRRYTGCPICAKPFQTSVSEKIVAFYLSKYFDDVKYNIRLEILERHELDIFIPSLNLAVEYDGGIYHLDLTRDIWKDEQCIKNGINLVRIRDNACPVYESKVKVITTSKSTSSFLELEKPIKELFEYINKTFNVFICADVDIRRDLQEVLSKIEQNKQEKSVLSSNVIDEWNYDRNKISPDSITQGNSDIKVWWKCKKCGYEWEAVPYSRTGLGCGCPACSHLVATKDNNLKRLFPELCKEWDYEKNSNSPEDVLPNSNISVWWKCSKCSYKWKTSPGHRTARHQGCPVCANRVVIIGINDFASQYPEIAKDWNYEKNPDKPTEIASGSNKKRWWKCHKCGYEWNLSLCVIAKNKVPCPACGNRQLFVGYNDIKTRYSNIIEAWDYSKNITKPEMYLSGSNEKVWWKCEKGHSYQQRISLKVCRGYGCPICSSKMLVTGINDFAHLEPELLKEWDYEKNEINPSEVSVRNKIKVWWKCDKGHSWSASIGQRVAHKTGCPVCYHLKRKKKTIDAE